ncbi:hypothetical protein YC2023_098442 [Brassica napus]
MYLVAHLVIKSFDGAFAVCVEDMGDGPLGAYVENGGDDDETGYDYSPAA